MTDEDVTTLLTLPLMHPVSVGAYVGIVLVAACILHPGCNDRAVRLVRAIRRLIKALRG